ncbi:hypothetical protein AB0M02_24255 [Actinoplanes sp. NPDC051861]|uniref:hypothetical protein n=1 Tax=Actinoplanes sp. NPDC051861 TaxID=3155170 RepID=UPI003449619C
MSGTFSRRIAVVVVQNAGKPRGALRHGLAVTIFGLLAAYGVAGVFAGAYALAVPMLVAGVAGSAGAIVITLSILRWRGLGVQRAARLGMAVAALVTVAVGVALAPAGWERGFVIAVDTGTGVLLALFAAFAGESGKEAAESGRS